MQNSVQAVTEVVCLRAFVSLGRISSGEFAGAVKDVSLGGSQGALGDAKLKPGRGIV